MRNFSWSCFQVTGNIDAYLLYKDMEALTERSKEQLEEAEETEET